MKKNVVLVAAILLITFTASAQMRHQPGQPPQSPGRGGLTPGMDAGGPMHLAVTENGTVALLERGTMQTGTLPADTLVAFNAAGVKAWTLKLDGMAVSFAAAGNQIYVLVVKEDSRSLVAVSQSGVIVWSVALD